MRRTHGSWTRWRLSMSPHGVTVTSDLSQLSSSSSTLLGPRILTCGVSVLPSGMIPPVAAICGWGLLCQASHRMCQLAGGRGVMSNGGRGTVCVLWPVDLIFCASFGEELQEIYTVSKRDTSTHISLYLLQEGILFRCLSGYTLLVSLSSTNFLFFFVFTSSSSSCFVFLSAFSFSLFCIVSSFSYIPLLSPLPFVFFWVLLFSFVSLQIGHEHMLRNSAYYSWLNSYCDIYIYIMQWTQCLKFLKNHSCCVYSLLICIFVYLLFMVCLTTLSVAQTNRPVASSSKISK
jgi:hypothetical protein